MQVSVAFRHMDTSNALQSYATRKLETILSKHINGQNVQAQIVFSVERFWHIANFTITVNGLTVKAVEKTENMYASVDLALDRLERQLRRYKERIRTHKPSERERQFTMNVLASPELEEPETSDAAADADAIPVEESPMAVVKQETYSAPYLTPEEALMQLHLRDAQFFVFTHKETERINILHRRGDGSYGLIDADPSFTA